MLLLDNVNVGGGTGARTGALSVADHNKIHNISPVSPNDETITLPTTGKYPIADNPQSDLPLPPADSVIHPTAEKFDPYSQDNVDWFNKINKKGFSKKPAEKISELHGIVKRLGLDDQSFLYTSNVVEAESNLEKMIKSRENGVNNINIEDLIDGIKIYLGYNILSKQEPEQTYNFESNSIKLIADLIEATGLDSFLGLQHRYRDIENMYGITTQKKENDQREFDGRQYKKFNGLFGEAQAEVARRKQVRAQQDNLKSKAIIEAGTPAEQLSQLAAHVPNTAVSDQNIEVSVDEFSTNLNNLQTFNSVDEMIKYIGEQEPNFEKQLPTNIKTALGSGNLNAENLTRLIDAYQEQVNLKLQYKPSTYEYILQEMESRGSEISDKQILEILLKYSLKNTDVLADLPIVEINYNKSLKSEIDGKEITNYGNQYKEVKEGNQITYTEIEIHPDGGIGREKKIDPYGRELVLQTQADGTQIWVASEMNSSDYVYPVSDIYWLERVKNHPEKRILSEAEFLKILSKLGITVEGKEDKDLFIKENLGNLNRIFYSYLKRDLPDNTTLAKQRYYFELSRNLHAYLDYIKIQNTEIINKQPTEYKFDEAIIRSLFDFAGIKMDKNYIKDPQIYQMSEVRAKLSKIAKDYEWGSTQEDLIKIEKNIKAYYNDLEKSHIISEVEADKQGISGYTSAESPQSLKYSRKYLEIEVMINKNNKWDEKEKRNRTADFAEGFLFAQEYFGNEKKFQDQLENIDMEDNFTRVAGLLGFEVKAIENLTTNRGDFEKILKGRAQQLLEALQEIQGKYNEDKNQNIYNFKNASVFGRVRKRLFIEYIELLNKESKNVNLLEVEDKSITDIWLDDLRLTTDQEKLNKKIKNLNGYFDGLEEMNPKAHKEIVTIIREEIVNKGPEEIQRELEEIAKKAYEIRASYNKITGNKIDPVNELMRTILGDEFDNVKLFRREYVGKMAETILRVADVVANAGMNDTALLMNLYGLIIRDARRYAKISSKETIAEANNIKNPSNISQFQPPQPQSSVEGTLAA